MATPLVDPAK
nr:RecName: Full=30 kDa non-secretory protein 1 [Mycobacterium tuberculosis H37Rv]